MTPIPSPAGLDPIRPMSASDLATLVDRARALRDAGAGPVLLLRGVNYGLLRDDDETGGEDATLFIRAATELGAQVARIRPQLTQFSAPQDVQQTAQMLGRLYDALACEGLDPALVQRLRAEAGVPVFDRLTSPDHPIAKAVALLGPSASSADNRRFVLQALLLTARN